MAQHTTDLDTERDRRVIRPEALRRLRSIIIEHFSRAEYHEVGIRDICKQAGVSPQTVYKYFGNKEDLLLACVEEDLARLGENAVAAATAAGDDVEAGLRGIFGAQFDFYAEHAAIARIIFLNLPTSYWVKRRSAAHARFYDAMERLIAEQQQLGKIRGDVPADVLRDWVTGGANRMLLRWITQGGDPAELAATCARLAWDTLRPRG